MHQQVFLAHPVLAHHGHGRLHPAQHDALAAALPETDRLAVLQADPILIAQGAVAKAVQHVVVEDDAVLQDLDEQRPPMARRRLDRLSQVRLVGDYRAPTKVASAASAISIGWIGCSMVPRGLDFVFLPNSEVGEYCPLVKP